MGCGSSVLTAQGATQTTPQNFKSKVPHNNIDLAHMSVSLENNNNNNRTELQIQQNSNKPDKLGQQQVSESGKYVSS